MNFVWAVVAGAVGAGVWSAIVLGYFMLGPWRQLRRIAGHYRVTRKLQPDEIECEALTVTVRLLTRTLTARSAAFGRDGGPFEATVVMSRELLNSGRGHYTHVKCVNGMPDRLYGFVELQVVDEDDAVLVHHTYADPQDRAVVSGFVWSRIT